MNVNSYKTLHLNQTTKTTGFGCTCLYASMHSMAKFTDGGEFTFFEKQKRD